MMKTSKETFPTIRGSATISGPKQRFFRCCESKHLGADGKPDGSVCGHAGNSGMVGESCFVTYKHKTLTWNQRIDGTYQIEIR